MGEEHSKIASPGMQPSLVLLKYWDPLPFWNVWETTWQMMKPEVTRKDSRALNTGDAPTKKSRKESVSSVLSAVEKWRWVEEKAVNFSVLRSVQSVSQSVSQSASQPASQSVSSQQFLVQCSAAQSREECAQYCDQMYWSNKWTRNCSQENKLLWMPGQ
jgi:hypothetical protein